LGQLQILFIPGPQIEMELTAPSVWQLYDAARKYQLSAYDACYLELAFREALPLATLDKGLSAAAAKAGISLM
jgi:predicted nucleic acid-binding protein